MNTPTPIDQTPAPEPTAPPVAVAPEHAFWQRAVVGLFVLGVFYTLYVTRTVLLPVIIAALLSFLLAPLKRVLQRAYVPGPLAAGLVVLLVMGLLGYGVSGLAEPAARWLDDVPRFAQQVERKLYPIRERVQEMSKAAEQVEKLAAPERRPQVVAADTTDLREMLLSGTQAVLVVIVMVAFLGYFFLASGETLLRKLVKVIPRLRDKIKAVQICQRIQQDVSKYLVTVTLINGMLGVATAVAMYLLGLPNPILWGVMAAAFNFVPYLGALMSLIVLTAVSLLTFNDLTQAVWVPLVFLALTTLEGQLITPVILGQRFALNPLVVFLAIVWWGWFWGVPGALIAVPLLVITKIICDHIDGLANVSEFLGR